MIRFVSVLLLSIVIYNANAQSKDLFLKLWNYKEQVELSEKASQKLSVFNDELKGIKKNIDLKEKEYYSVTTSTPELKKEIIALYSQKHQLINSIKQDALESKDEAMFLELIQFVRPADLRELLEFEQLGEERAATYKEWLNNIAPTEVGTKFQHFTLNDDNGKKVNTKKMKGQVFWIDSWASKCAPCIKKLKQMKPVYEQYHKKGFEIIAISWDYQQSGYMKSLDEATKDWKKALDRYEFPWINVFDEGDKVMQEQFSSVGKNTLVDEDGVIIGFDLKPIEIEAILKDKY